MLVDNFSYGTASAGETPEAATMIMVGTGLILVWRLRKGHLLHVT